MEITTLQEKNVHDIDVLLRCGDRFCEVPSTNIPLAELVVEERASLELITLFEEVRMGNVSVTFQAATAESEAEIVISIRAYAYGPLPSLDLAHLDCAVEDRLSCSLIELFGMLSVERCAVV